MDQIGPFERKRLPQSGERDFSTPLYLQVSRNGLELFEGRLEIVGDFLGQDFGVGEVFAVFQAFVLEPEDVQVRLVALDQVLVVEGAPAAIGFLLRVPRRPPLAPRLGLEALDEIVQVAALQGLGLQREVHVRPQVVDPEPFRPRLLARGLGVEKQDVCRQNYLNACQILLTCQPCSFNFSSILWSTDSCCMTKQRRCVGRVIAT